MYQTEFSPGDPGSLSERVIGWDSFFRVERGCQGGARRRRDFLDSCAERIPWAKGAQRAQSALRLLRRRILAVSLSLSAPFKSICLLRKY